MTTTQTPEEFDTELAALYGEAEKASRNLDSIKATILHAAGAKYYYRGKQRVTDMTLADALPVVQAELDAKVSGYTLLRGCTIRSYDGPSVTERLAEAQAKVQEIRDAIATKEAGYTGWSRFFLVTSSRGHIHSSMRCSTCRQTTTYGWLPGLSGRNEADAVAECGPALCSVCYPSAPVEWVGGWITKAQAERKAQ